MESIQTFLKLDHLFKAEVNVSVKYPIYLKFGQLAKINIEKKYIC